MLSIVGFTLVRLFRASFPDPLCAHNRHLLVGMYSSCVWLVSGGVYKTRLAERPFDSLARFLLDIMFAWTLLRYSISSCYLKVDSFRASR